MCPPKRCCCCPLYEGVKSWFVILSVMSCFGALLSFGSAKWANEMLGECEEMEPLHNAPVPWSSRRNDSTGPGAEGELPLFVVATVCEPQFADKATCQQPACIETLDAMVVAGWVEVFISIVYCTVRRRTPVDAATSCCLLGSAAALRVYPQRCADHVQRARGGRAIGCCTAAEICGDSADTYHNCRLQRASLPLRC